MQIKDKIGSTVAQLDLQYSLLRCVNIYIEYPPEKKEAEDLAQLVRSRGFFCEITAAE